MGGRLAINVGGFCMVALAFCANAAAVPGDLDCFCGPTFDDVGPFILAILDPDQYAQENPRCAAVYADLNADGQVDGRDIPLFVAAIDQGGLPSIVELAGRPLTSYPYFDFVTTFNTNATVSLAVDPFRLPGLAGRTCDVYVVAGRTTEEWLLDATLVDARASGPQTVMFTADSIQSNTIPLAEPGTLVPPAAVELGAPYDVVIDANRNALLDACDYIDGSGEQAGFHLVSDLCSPGPLTPVSITYSGGAWLGQRIWYPANLAELGRLPLVVLSHGNGHDYTWYDYLLRHLASHGFIAMSHTTNTGPGVEAAGTSTLENTDHLIAHQAVIGGGVLHGHVDAHRIAWIGHSRGGEGVVRAYDRLYDGEYVPSHFGREDIRLVSAIAPTDHLGPSGANPHDVPFHLLYGAADGDVTGGVDNNSRQPFQVFERATGFRQSTYVHGADHNDFNCCGVDDFTGPPVTAIGRAEAQRVAKGAYLALLKHYLEGSVAGGDFLWRQSESLKPIGVAATTTIVSQYRQADAATKYVIEDYQTNPGLAVSSCSGTVTHDVSNLLEGLLDDSNTNFTWVPSDPMNGMSLARPEDTTRGAVFDWSDWRFLEFSVPAEGRRFDEYEWLSFRACQGARHPLTSASTGDLTFTVSLRDAAGRSSGVNIGTYGGGIEKPYQRTGLGEGAGWQNEFETVRIRLTDFLAGGSGLDLRSVVAVRFDFGGSLGTAQGRLGFDDLELTAAHHPRPLPLRIELPEAAPAVIPPDEPTSFTVQITGRDESVVPDTAALNCALGGAAYLATPLLPLGGDLYQATIPPPNCGIPVRFYLSIEGTTSGLHSLPELAPAEVFEAVVAHRIDCVALDFETDPGWQVSGDALAGHWERGPPAGGVDRGAPPTDYDGSGQCFLTGNAAGDSDVDAGTTILTSGPHPLEEMADPRLAYARWYSNHTGAYPESDTMVVEISINGGSTWSTLETVGPCGPQARGGWYLREFRLRDYVGAAQQFMIRWRPSDLGGASVVEAAIDAFAVYELVCSPGRDAVDVDNSTPVTAELSRAEELSNLERK